MAGLELIDPVVDQRHCSNLQDGQLPQPSVFVPTMSCGYLTTGGFHGLCTLYLVRSCLACSNLVINILFLITGYVLLVYFRSNVWLSNTGTSVRIFQLTVHSSLLGLTAGDRRCTRSTYL